MKKKNRLVSLVLTFALLVMTAFVPKMDAQAAEWQLVWNDEFDGNSLDTSKWSYDIGNGEWGWGNNELQYYTNRNDNVSISNGALKLTAIKENYGGCSYTSGKITTRGKYNVKYGKIEFRLKSSIGQGIWPAAWMLGKNHPNQAWPYCGEIDVFEHVNTENKVYGTVHWDSGGYATYGGNLAGVDITQYHVYSIEWDEEYIVWYCDGQEYHRILIKDSTGGTNEFHEEMYLLLNLAVGGNWPGNPDGSTKFPAEMYVDYVRVYQKTGSGSSSGSTGGGSSSGTDATLQESFNNWSFLCGSDWAGAYANVVKDSSNQATLTIANAGYGGEWGIQFYDSYLPLKAGKTYKVSFDVLSWNNKSMGLYLQNNGTDLINQRLYLGAGQKQSVSFTSQAAGSDGGAIYMSFGANDSSENNTATTIVISNFKLEEVGANAGGSAGGNAGGNQGGGTQTQSGATVSASGNSAVVTLTGTSWADIHYQVNGGGQMNVRMTQSGTTSTYTIPNLNQGDSVSYWFTYCPSGEQGAKDTASATYTHSGTSAGTTPGATPGTKPGAAPGTKPGAAPGTKPGAAPGATATTLDGVYYIKSVHSGKYLDVANGSAANGANIQQYEFNGTTAQQFKLVSDGNGYYSILTGCSNYKSGVDVYDWSPANGTNIGQWEYHGGNCQKFEIVKVGNAYAIKTRVTNSKSCLDVFDWNTANGGNIGQWEYHGGNCQLWYLEKVK